MQIGCTQMHPVTLAAIIIELIILGAQGGYFLSRPHNTTRLWYIGLLVLIIALNLVNGLFANPAYRIPLFMQHNTVTAVGIAVICYFPLYFYRGFGLQRLRFHARYGIFLFLLFPYFVFFIIVHSLTEDTDMARRYGYIVPVGYAVVLLLAIADAIRHRYRETRNKKHMTEELMAYIALLPWAAMAPIVYLKMGQLTETVFINGGFLVLSVFLLYRSITIGLAEQRQLENLRQVAVDFEVVKHNCIREMLSPRETEVASMLCQRLTAREIADKLFISDRTVDKHRENIYFKVGVNSREELIDRLNKVR